ncbi:ribosome small subunit-dependent GTPase A [Lutimonas sp.]|uniref:ribosome small subunit-dependent GTPase A n=1 Tax=Lutimonas sp. TaxID=1872403 RepID=UPI003D9BF8A1
MTGVVVKSTGSWYWVRTESHAQIQCRIRGKFRTKGIKSTNPLTVGDHVDFEMELNTNTGVITNIHDRKNYIVRKSVNLSKQTHIIAANIDLAFLLVTLDNPPTFPPFIDRFLATAEAYGIEAILLFNKMDLNDEKLESKKNELVKIYSDIGYQCIEMAATENMNIEKVKNLMLGKISMFSGHSGVGKSTLINAIDPSLQLKTAAVSSQHKQGQHTTTFAEMFAIPTEPESYIIDTPGIKGFGVVDFEKHEISDYFPEFFARKDQCKFNNCLHVNEPKCAVKQALENGEISTSRYRSYLQLLEGEEENYRTNTYDF